MTTPLHYQHSYVYLRDRMSRISRGLVVTGLAVISAALVVAGVYGLATFIINLF
jgi:hypothetical protein